MTALAPIETEDPTVHIVVQSDNMKHYRDIAGREWVIYGQCNACGACEDFPETEEFPFYETKVNKVKLGDLIVEKERQVVWFKPPGTEHACHDIGFEDRLDTPITPDLPNRIEVCTLSGEWINGH